MRFHNTVGAVLLLGTGTAAQGGLQRPNVGEPRWNAAIARASSMLSDATPEELNNLTYGFAEPNGCGGNSGSLPRLGYPGMCLNDGPAGLKSDLTTGFASGVSVAASWNRQLAGERGYWMGREFRNKGVQVALGPSLGPLGRTVLGGRAWEGFGADPYLTGQLGAETVSNIQKSVISVIKHYILNEQETARLSLVNLSMSSEADDQTLHELYVTPFQDAIKAGAAGVMCSYNRVNNTYGCENDRTLNQILKDELNFPGFVVSDWIFGQRSGVPSATGGLDMAMPNSNLFWAEGRLADAVQVGNLTMNRLRDMASRILSSWLLITGPESGTLEPGSGMPQSLLGANTLTDAREPESRPSTKQSAIEGHVLVKNVNNALPLRSPRLMSIFGWDAINPLVKNPSLAEGISFTPQTVGLQSVNVSDGEILAAGAGNQLPREISIADQGTLLNGGGSGSITASYWLDPMSALSYQARQDQTFLYWDLRSTEPLVAQSSEACLVFINQISAEAVDRRSLSDSASDTLVNTVAGQCRNTIVIMHNAWVRLVDDWIDHPNVTAVMFAHLPGQESGEALVDLLYGRTSPSGRLPYTVARQESDYGDLLRPANVTGDDGAPHAVFSEGVNIDYRHFLENDIEPRFPFGYGLTYASFEYSYIEVEWIELNRPEFPPNPEIIIPGGVKSLWDWVARVGASIQNTGDVPAAEVSQLYVQFPGDERVRHLRGFSKDIIASGDRVVVNFGLTRRDLSRWNTAEQSWQMQRGEYRFFVGPNVNDVVLQATLSN